MKSVIFLIDGMADDPLEELGGKTPLEAARKPIMNGWAKNAAYGTFLTLPAGFPTSSDVANMSVLGWDLATSYTGRGAIETYGAGLELAADTVAFRMNLITVKDGILEDYSAGHISAGEAEELIEFLQKELGTEEVILHKGVSYRHLLHLKGKKFSSDILYEKPDSSHGEEWEKILPKAKNEAARETEMVLVDLMYRSFELLKNHPVNLKRMAAGKNPANIVWPWSGGKKPDMLTFEQQYGKKGAIISAVDVILGLGRLGGMEYLRPEGATGYIDTNYENKARAGVDMLTRNDFVYVHVEAADECAHLGDWKNKTRVIEDCDQRLIGVFMEEYRKRINEPLRVMVLPDHPVPIRLRQHTRTPVPVMIWGEGVSADTSIQEYSERFCPQGRYAGLSGRGLMDLLFHDGAI